jgi:hypothetical protein
MSFSARALISFQSAVGSGEAASRARRTGKDFSCPSSPGSVGPRTPRGTGLLDDPSLSADGARNYSPRSCGRARGSSPAEARVVVVRVGERLPNRDPRTRGARPSARGGPTGRARSGRRSRSSPRRPPVADQARVDEVRGDEVVPLREERGVRHVGDVDEHERDVPRPEHGEQRLVDPALVPHLDAVPRAFGSRSRNASSRSRNGSTPRTPLRSGTAAGRRAGPASPELPIASRKRSTSPPTTDHSRTFAASGYAPRRRARPSAGTSRRPRSPRASSSSSRGPSRAAGSGSTSCPPRRSGTASRRTRACPRASFRRVEGTDPALLGPARLP